MQKKTYQTARAFVIYTNQVLNVRPLSADFSQEFDSITASKT
jgi:hypothetical protein